MKPGGVVAATVSLTILAATVAGCADDSRVSVTATDPVDDSVVIESSGLPEGFTTVGARITAADGEECEVCLWLADDPSERGRGLMGVTDLGDAAGMAFVFDDATRGAFYMFQTPTPLSIAWFAPSGEHVGSADMAPCIDSPADACPRYAPDSEYDLAIEVFEGGLAALGIGPGARVELLPGTEAERCPVG